jgi:hypothetical protein
MIRQRWHNAGTRYRRRHRQEIFHGFLECEQCLEWHGRLPARDVVEQLPELLARAHFAEVERSVAGLIRCRRDGDRIACRLLGRWPGLIFAEDRIEGEAHAVTARWRILGGLLARPEPAGYGVLTLGFTATLLPGEGALLALYSRVEGFPSRFLALGPGIRVRWPRPLVARIYAAYHRWVTFRYLHRVARVLDAAG